MGKIVQVSDETWNHIVANGYQNKVKSVDTVIKECFEENLSLTIQLQKSEVSYSELEKRFDKLLDEHLAMVQNVCGGLANGQS